MAFLDIEPIGSTRFAEHMKDATAHMSTVLVDLTPSRATPQSRKRSIDDAAGEEAGKLSGDFTKRRALS